VVDSSADPELAVEWILPAGALLSPLSHADYIICIDCGYKGKMLKRHLQSRHGLSVAQYKTRWKLPSDYSTTSANYSQQRSQLAKQIGLGRGAAQPAAATTASATEKLARRSASKTTRTRTSAKKATPTGSAKKASGRSRKPTSKTTRKAAIAPTGATA
jgi:hypothetical protein